MSVLLCGPASVLLPVDSTQLTGHVAVVVGTHDGQLALYTSTAEGKWEQAETVPLDGAAVVDGVLSLLPGLLLVGCAGELTVRALPNLRRVAGPAVATRCTGAFCVQEHSRAAAAGRKPSEETAHVCAALHNFLLLIEVDDGATDAQIAPTELRAKAYAKIAVHEEAVALVWRDGLLSVAHPSCYVVLDVRDGCEIWRLHLRPAVRRAPSPPAVPEMPSVRRAASSPALAAPASERRRSTLFGSAFGSSHRRTSSRGSVGEADVAPLLLAAGSFDAPPSPPSEFVLVEQMVWLPRATATTTTYGAAVSPGGRCANGGGSSSSGSGSSALLGTGRGGSSASGGVRDGGSDGGPGSPGGMYPVPSPGGMWVGEQRGRCWLDVGRACEPISQPRPLYGLRLHP